MTGYYRHKVEHILDGKMYLRGRIHRSVNPVTSFALFLPAVIVTHKSPTTSSRNPPRTARYSRPSLSMCETRPRLQLLSKSSLVVSLVGIMHGSPKDFEDIQWKGASDIAKAAQSVGANLVHFSSIGTGPSSSIPYTRTKGLGEISVLEHCPSATIIRPSLVFGPEDDFFNIFPFLPVFGGGASKFQPVYVKDLMHAVEIIAIADAKVRKEVSAKIMEAGGPDVFIYRELMSLVLKYNG
ncbi:uncharacterized protein ARMOST_10859 [Armillaria ostoyae]|uniref:NAD(P)-binding domain-containing protein n=1 Tax=Armillaria ostoyae TaxID=47428 RepID=A0A284RFH8_ARMOS|nr:uncharacterized protein ARMOST_10859 [Armillaria ostoyae]